jgi:hypothetical protein
MQAPVSALMLLPLVEQRSPVWAARRRSIMAAT